MVLQFTGSASQKKRLLLAPFFTFLLLPYFNSCFLFISTSLFFLFCCRPYYHSFPPPFFFYNSFQLFFSLQLLALHFYLTFFLLSLSFYNVTYWFLDVFAKFRKANISFVMSVLPSFCLPVCSHRTTRLLLKGF
jgi:hypothetical protein